MQAYYDGDRDYFKAVKNDTLNVEKSTTELRIDSLVSETGMMDIEAFINENATGNITITITNANGTTIQTTQQTTINGTVILDPIFVENNTYTINATYTGDDNYYKATNTTNIEITKKQTNIIITSVKVDDLGNINVIIKIDENATGNITLTFNDTEETLEIINGTATLENYRLAKGNYTIVATSPEDEENFQSVKNATLIISKDIPAMNAILTMDENIVFIETAMYENATGNVTYAVYRNGTFIKEESVEIINGIAKFTDRLVKGQYDFFIEYQGDDNYFKANTTLNTSVDKVMPEINYSVEINGKNVIIYVNIENATGIVEYSSAIDKYNN